MSFTIIQYPVSGITTIAIRSAASFTPFCLPRSMPMETLVRKINDIIIALRIVYRWSLLPVYYINSPAPYQRKKLTAVHTPCKMEVGISYF